MQPVDLYDRLDLDTDAEGLSFTCSRADLAGDDNLVVKAARAWFDAAQMEPAIAIHLEKKVPVAAGIGGGSSDAAAALLGLNALFGGRLDRGMLHRVAAGLGSDIPFFLGGSAAWCTGKGERVRPWPDFPRLHYVVINPGIGVSTAWVYRTYDLHWTNPTRRHTIGCPLRTSGTWDTLLVNDLESVTIEAHPELAEIKKGLMAAGAEGALMSGSGPTVFGIFPDAQTARRASEGLAAQTGYWVKACRGIVA